jgi:Tol biopolymer transport system component
MIRLAALPSRVTILIILLSALAVAPVEAQLMDYFAGKNKINYDTFNWRRYDTEHFQIYYYPEEEAYLDEVVNWAETGYEIISQRLNHQLKNKVPIIFFKTHSEFEQTNIIPMFLPEGIGAFAEPRMGRVVIPLDFAPVRMQRLFTHELTHAFQYDIFYQDRIPNPIAGQAPLWVIEGMAEYMSDGLTDMDEMLLRDAVVNDFVPTVDEIANAGGFYIPYVYGNAIYNYIAEKYGVGAVKDFVWELRKTGATNSGVKRSIKELFKVTDDKFSREFRLWLRDKYIPALVEKEEPEEYGELLSHPKFEEPIFSPQPSPSGDLVAALSFRELDFDLVLVSGKDGSLFSNLTPGYTNRYEYLIGQGVTTTNVDGRDLAWSPDGKKIAVFARKGKNRDLLLIDPVRRGIIDQVGIDADQSLSPYFLPDGERLVFSASNGGVRDIYLFDLRTKEMTNLTEDEAFDYAPAVSPDGKKIVYTSVVDGLHTKLFIFDLDKPETKTQLTYGSFDDMQPDWNPDGKRVIYVSNETGISNIYTYELESGEISQFTDVLGGAFTPAYDPQVKDKSKIYFSSFLKRRYQLYSMNLENPIRTFNAQELKQAEAGQVVDFSPVVKMAIDEEQKNKQPRFTFHLDDAFAFGGVASDGTLLSLVGLRFTDMFGDESLTMVFNTIASYRSYAISYFNQRRRFNWGLLVYDQNTFLAGNPMVFAQPSDLFVERTTVENLGVRFFTRYPFNKFLRAEFFTGFNNRTYTFDAQTLSSLPPDFKENMDTRFGDGNFLYFGASLIGDTARYNPAFGPLAGRRWEIGAIVAPGFRGDFKGYTTFTGEVRNYLKLNTSTLIASRAFIGYSRGDAPDLFIFGGLNTLRGYDFLSVVGNRAFYVNNEFRFPLIDYIRFPGGIGLGNIRGVLFWDLGGAWYQDEEFTFMENGRLVDALSSVGFGFSFNFGYFPMNFDWAKTWNFKEFGDDWKFSFWVGQKF